MLAIDELLRQATRSPADTIVHVGAGSGAVLDRYAHLAPSKVVLLEGDPEAAAALRRAARPFPWAQVVAQAAAREGGEVLWNRYSLPTLNGPVAADALTSRYPRLRRESVASVPGISLSSLLQSVLDSASVDESTVLLLDVPGQEGALLESLGDELRALAAVVVRRCALPLPDAAVWSMVCKQMSERSFELVGQELDCESLWPVAVFRFDRRRHEARMLSSEVGLLTASIAGLQHDLAAASANSDRLESLERRNGTAEKTILTLSAVLNGLIKRTNERQCAEQESDSELPKPKDGIEKQSSDTSTGKQYYGLHELDRKLETYLDFDNGFFVELGANDGVAQSNTLYFEKERNWRGVLIEPILHKFLACRQNRAPDNSFYCAACVATDYTQPYVRLTYSNLMTVPHEVDSDIANPTQHARSGSVYLPVGESVVDVMAAARTLGSLLDEAGAPDLMDLLSLDVEGGELGVLKGLDHQRHRFRYMLVESRCPERLTEYLSQVGYIQIDKLSHHDYLYALR